MRWVRVLLCVLGAGFVACGLSPIEDVPSASDKETNGSGGAASGGSSGGPLLGTGSTGAAGHSDGAFAGAAGRAGAENGG